MSNPSLLIAKTGRLSDEDSLYLLSAEVGEVGKEFEDVLTSTSRLDGFHYTRVGIPYGIGNFLNRTPNRASRTPAFSGNVRLHLCSGQNARMFEDEFLDEENITTYFPPSGGKSFGSTSDGKKKFSSGVVGLVGSKKQDRVLQLKTSGLTGKHTIHLLPGRGVSATASRYLWVFSNRIADTKSSGKFYTEGTAQDLEDFVTGITSSSGTIDALFYALVTNSHVFVSEWTKEAYEKDDQLPPIAMRFEVCPAKTRECVEALLLELVQDNDSANGPDHYLDFYGDKVAHIMPNTQFSANQAAVIGKKKRKLKLKKKEEKAEEPLSLLDSCMFGDDEMDILL